MRFERRIFLSPSLMLMKLESWRRASDFKEEPSSSWGQHDVTSCWYGRVGMCCWDAADEAEMNEAAGNGLRVEWSQPHLIQPPSENERSHHSARKPTQEKKEKCRTGRCDASSVYTDSPSHSRCWKLWLISLLVGQSYATKRLCCLKIGANQNGAA